MINLHDLVDYKLMKSSLLKLLVKVDCIIIYQRMKGHYCPNYL
jgi:hypothetical protein